MKSGYKYLALIVIIGITSLFLTARVNAQNQTIDDLTQRLKQRNIPLKSVAIKSRVPFQVEITLQSLGHATQALDDTNAWFILLTEREATLAYRWGTRIDSYVLTLVNDKGEQLSQSQQYLYPNDRNQQLGTPTPAQVDNITAQKLIVERLRTGEMSIQRLEVIPDALLESRGQILLIELLVTDAETANRSLAPFMTSLYQTLDTLNTNQGARIILCRLKVLDRHGRVLFTFMRDLEVGYTKQAAIPELDRNAFIRRGPPTPVPTLAPYPPPR